MTDGGFAGGLASGIDAGSQIAARFQAIKAAQMQIDAAKRDLAARAAMYHGLGAGQSGPQNGAPGPAALPPGMAGPGGAPAPPQGPPPQAQGGPVPVPMPGAQPMPGPPAPPPMPQGGGGAGPAAPPQQDGMSGVASPTGSFEMDSRKTLMAIAQDIKQRNPNIDDLTLASAVDQTITSMKGVSEVDKSYMQALVQSQAIQQRADAALQRAQTAEDVANIRAEAYKAQYETMLKVAGVRAGAQTESAKIGAGSRVQAAQIGAGSREAVAGTQAGARIGAAKIGAGSREHVADTAAGASRFRTQTQADTQGFMRPVAKPVAKAAPEPMGGNNAATLRNEARQALAKGAPRAKVVQRLQELGVSSAGL